MIGGEHRGLVGAAHLVGRDRQLAPAASAGRSSRPRARSSGRARAGAARARSPRSGAPTPANTTRRSRQQAAAGDRHQLLRRRVTHRPVSSQRPAALLEQRARADAVEETGEAPGRVEVLAQVGLDARHAVGLRPVRRTRRSARSRPRSGRGTRAGRSRTAPRRPRRPRTPGSACGRRGAESPPVGTTSSAVTITVLAARAYSASMYAGPSTCALPSGVDRCTWISATSGTSAGTATSSSPVSGQCISCAGVRASMSEPSSEAVGQERHPHRRGQEPQAEREVAPLLVDARGRARRTGGTPSGCPSAGRSRPSSRRASWRRRRTRNSSDS